MNVQSALFGDFGLVYRLTSNLSAAYLRLPIKPCYGLLRSGYRRYLTWHHKSHAKQRSRIVVANVDGINYELDLRQLIDSSIYYRRCFEPYTTAIINKYIKPGMIVLDIGANIGCHTLRLAKLVGESGKVIAFEPTTWAFVKLQKNVSLNRFGNVVLEKLALSDHSGDETTWFRSSWQLDAPPEYEGTKEPMRFVRLDDYVARTGIERIDFIKLDVDGYESKVLRGAIATLGRFKPIVIVECSTKPDVINANVVDTVGILSSLGYDFYSEKKLKKYKNKEAMFRHILRESSTNIVSFPQPMVD